MNNVRRSNFSKTAIVSIHDVMPHTLPDVLGILDVLRKMGVSPVTLLIVPGVEWKVAEIEILEKMQKAGLELAGHGWNHRAAVIRSPWHWVHSKVISRKEAEHLSLPADDIEQIIYRCYHWFESVSLSPPELYVPPAWAMGKISRKRLKHLPFVMYENLFGIWDTRHETFQHLPVAGYMADSPFRKYCLRTINAIARKSTAPQRIAIHPEDFGLGMADDVQRILACTKRFAGYADIRG